MIFLFISGRISRGRDQAVHFHDGYDLFAGRSVGLRTSVGLRSPCNLIFRRQTLGSWMERTSCSSSSHPQSTAASTRADGTGHRLAGHVVPGTGQTAAEKTEAPSSRSATTKRLTSVTRLLWESLIVIVHLRII